jgi:hypothetical protein
LSWALASGILKIYFQAGVTITSLQKSPDTAIVTFGAKLDRVYILQSTGDLNAPNSWTNSSDTVVGTDALTPLVDYNVSAQTRFYRIKDITP